MFDAVGGSAFAAQAKGDAATDSIAILCNRSLSPRTDFLTAMRGIDHPGVLRLRDSGIVAWPSDGVSYFALSYMRPLAPRFKQSLDEPHQPPSEDNINHYFVAPMIGALSEFLRTGVVHNAIRPSNIFWRLGTATVPQLGDCLSAPAGLGQPTLFESIERALCSPLGRGTGSHTDDCYALGVTLACLVLGHNPMQGMDDRAIINAKIERGSFNALVGNNRLSPTHSELLRGLLTDDAKQRWSATELEQWMNGRRLTPKNSDIGRRASRSMEFIGKEYTQIRPLAIALAEQTEAATQIIENGALDKWLRRALGDEERANDLAEAISGLKESGKIANYEDQIVARTCITLDPSAPIRYRGITTMPGGIANLIVDTIQRNESPKVLIELISGSLLAHWFDTQKELKPDFVSMSQHLERMKLIVEKSSYGSGVERVAYELNAGLPCLSPMLKSQYVTTPRALLPALERIAGDLSRPSEPMDRHIAAFLIVRDRRSEMLFSAMTAPDAPLRKGIALLTLFSEMQYKYGSDALPHLAQWLLPLLEASVQRFLSKSLREKMQKQIRESASRGNLGGLLRMVDDFRMVERDRQDFMAARLLYLNTTREIIRMETILSRRDTVVQEEGKPLAAALSGMLAVLLVIATILRAMWHGFFG
jgi:serine/threonine protein kinase